MPPNDQISLHPLKHFQYHKQAIDLPTNLSTTTLIPRNSVVKALYIFGATKMNTQLFICSSWMAFCLIRILLRDLRSILHSNSCCLMKKKYLTPSMDTAPSVWSGRWQSDSDRQLRFEWWINVYIRIRNRQVYVAKHVNRGDLEEHTHQIPFAIGTHRVYIYLMAWLLLVRLWCVCLDWFLLNTWSIGAMCGELNCVTRELYLWKRCTFYSVGCQKCTNTPLRLGPIYASHFM